MIVGVVVAIAALVSFLAPSSDPSPSVLAEPTTTTRTGGDTTTTGGVAPTLAPPAGAERATVVRIIDGDTVEVEMMTGETEVTRLIGINTPESGECFSTESTIALAALVLDEVVTMTIDTSDRDQYDRLLRYIWLDRGVFVNEIMVRGGYAQARDYPPDSAHADLIARAQELARTGSLGIWAQDACGPAADADLRVIEVLPDPPGADADNLEGEWVDIVNAGSSEVAMKGWVLKDESSRHRYLFPEAFVLAPQAVVRVRTGCGTDDAETLNWCNGSAVWNNAGDTAFLLDPNGNVVFYYEY
jgi:micrococcal nuclease